MSLVFHGSSRITLAIQLSRQVARADAYVLYMLTHLLARFHLVPKGSSTVKTTPPGLQ